MGRMFFVFLSLLVFDLHVSLAQTNPKDAASLRALVSDWQNQPSNWVGSDPCTGGWVGISCTNGRIVSIGLASQGLNGSLTGDIGGLTELQSLDLSYNVGMGGTLPSSIGTLKKLNNLVLIGCNFYGEIPDLSGLPSLIYLSLNLNKFSGSIPPSVGRLSKLLWLDLADNMLSGPLPISNATSPGLDQLIGTKHFHLGNNKLSGTIPPGLFSSKMQLIHLLLDNNNLEGRIPSTLGLVKTMEVIRLDGNKLTNSVPANINNLTNLGQLYLSNNKLTGPIPDLTGMSKLTYVDLSNNTFVQALAPPWFSSLQSLTTLIAENLMNEGPVPADMFLIPQLQTVRLKHNLLNDTLNISNGYSSQLQLVDLRNNRIENVAPAISYNQELMLYGNPYCQALSEKYCSDTLLESTQPYTTPINCVADTCITGQDLSPKCACAYPYTGTLYFRAPSFSNLGNFSRFQSLEAVLINSFTSTPASSVYLFNITWTSNNYLQIGLKVFPSNESSFTQKQIFDLGFILSNQVFKPPPGFGPFYFVGTAYSHFADATTQGSSSKTSLAVIIGAIAGGVALAIVIAALAIYGCKQRKRAKEAEIRSQPFGTWDRSKSSGAAPPQLKGARYFSFDELKRYTGNFSDENSIGSGGYGKVYRGVLENKQLVAVKRAEQGSMQGGLEFKTEIELLSRVHHRNLVSLVGFCFDKGEQMLVYEYIPNGTLRESLSGKSGVRLDWSRRLRVALGSARGLSYLHELANPPIVHRDVKSSNILLDDHLVAKVADFGLSKALPDGDRTHVTTQVKGTMGYLDPQYYMTQKLTEKSDVYSFGVVMLELVTARQPLEHGRHIVREVNSRMNRSDDLYGLHELLDPTLAASPSSIGFERFIDLSLRCVEEEAENRPTMSVVVKEIESIMQHAGINPNIDSAQSSASYEQSGSDHQHHPYSNEGITGHSSVPIAR